MAKESAFIGVGSSPSFEYTNDAVHCYSYIFRLEKMCGNDITISSLLSFFGIDRKKAKITRMSDFYAVSSEEASSLMDKYLKAKKYI